jgi:SAM-dependent methyltransferase
MTDSLIARQCPVCGSGERRTIVELTQHSFVSANDSYRGEVLPKLGLDPDQLYPIVSCLKCGMDYTAYHLDDAGEAIVYGELIDESVSLSKILAMGRRTGDHQRWLTILTALRKGGRKNLDLNVLDYGCGWGTLLTVANGPAVTVTGFDMTPWKINYARENGVTVVESEDGVRERGPYDVIISTSVLEHLHDPAESLKTMAQSLKPEGIAYITCDIFGGIRSDNRKAWAQVKDQLNGGIPIRKEVCPWEHHNYFSPTTFLKIMDEAGFEPVHAPGAWLGTQTPVRDFLKYCVQTRLPKGMFKYYQPGYWKLKK